MTNLKISPNKLLVSEHFYSVQGEGVTSGYPAYFIRLSQCNLFCGCTPKFVNQLKKGELQFEPGEFQGDLHKEGKGCSWTCDTIPVWINGQYMGFQELIDSWKDQGIYEDICNGLIHIIWTGGEPTIKQHQESIANFTQYWNELVQPEHEIDNATSYYEIETNGTVYIEDDLVELLDQINCSPKLSNSGQPKKARIVPEAIERIKQHKNHWFKFVISTEDDIFEMFDTFINPFNIPLTRVICMPGLDSADNFNERTRWILEMSKKYKFIGLTRLHVAAWDKTTGV